MEEIKKRYIGGLTFHYVDTLEEALPYILEADRVTTPQQWKLTREKR